MRRRNVVTGAPPLIVVKDVERLDVEFECQAFADPDVLLSADILPTDAKAAGVVEMR